MTTITLKIAGTIADLFDDEVVSLTKQRKDMQDLGRLFADFSQPFTIPATDVNNGIFTHWYNLDIDDPYDAHGKADAEISVDGIVLFTGTLELVSCEIADHQPISYEVIFYGQTKQILTEFGEDTLRDISYGVELTLTYTNMVSSWSGSYLGGSVVFPVFDYGGRSDGAMQYDISSNAVNSIARSDSAPVKYNELRPAFRLSDVMESIFASIDYQIELVSDLETEFDALYMLPMEKEGYIDLSFDGTWSMIRESVTLPDYTPPAINPGLILTSYTTEVSDPSGAIDISNGIFEVQANGQHVISITFEDATRNAGYMFWRVFDVTNPNTTTDLVWDSWIVPQVGAGSDTRTFTYTRSLTAGRSYRIKIWNAQGNAMTFTSITWSCIQAPLLPPSSTIERADVMPDIKINEFIGSLIKSFNLVGIPERKQTGGGTIVNNLKLYKFDDWIAEGTNVDVSDQVHTIKQIIRKQPFPERIELKHAESEDLANVSWRDAFGRTFGRVVYDNDGDDFTGDAIEVESPFAIMPPLRMMRVTGSGVTNQYTDLEVMPFMDAEGKAMHIPLSLWYFSGYESVNDEWWMNNDSATPTLQSSFPYFRAWNDVPVGASDQTIAYGYEIAPSNEVVTDTLYSRTFKKYLDTIFNPKMRIIEVDMYLNIAQWLTLKLNDTLVITGRAYQIESVKYNVITGKASFKLYTSNERVRAIPTFTWGSGIMSVTWDTTPSPSDLTLYNTQRWSTLSGYKMKSPNFNTIPNAVMRNDAHRQKSEVLHQTNCMEIIKNTTTTYSSVGTTFVDVDSYDGEEIQQGKGFDFDLTNGEIIANESMIVHASASLEFSHDASRDIIFAYLIDGNETGFENFAERKAEHLNLIGTFRIDAGQTLTIAMKLATAHTMDIDVDAVHFVVHEI